MAHLLPERHNDGNATQNVDDRKEDERNRKNFFEAEHFPFEKLGAQILLSESANQSFS
tara:strand:+ start:17 stop:190 length:174 start_codon:yes stop_codon:yes gene_type:complete